MKKTLIALLALVGVAAAESLTLNITELKTSNNMLTWTDADVSELTSWELSFTLDSQRASLTEQDLMFFPDDTHKVKFAVNANGSLEFYGSSIFTASGATEATDSVSSVAGMVTTDATAITLSFVGNEKAGEIIGGTLSATASGKTFTVAVSEAVTLTKTAGGIRIWSNGAQEHYTQLSLKALSNKVVPEPTTATLSLLALAGLAARRRRK